MEYGEKIKQIRKKSLLSQRDFAKEVGVTYATVARWETGEREPSWKCLRKVKEFCDRKGIDIVL